LSLLDGELISQQDFESHKNELLAKFVRRFAPQYTIEVIEEYKALHSMMEQGLVHVEDESHIFVASRIPMNFSIRESIVAPRLFDVAISDQLSPKFH